MSDQQEISAEGQGELGNVMDEPVSTQTTNTGRNEYIKMTTVVFAAVGVGLGGLMYLLGTFGSYPFVVAGDVSGGNMEELTTGYYEAMAVNVIQLVPVLAVVLAGVIGVVIGHKHDADRSTAATDGGVSAGIGTAVFVLLATGLASTQVGESGPTGFIEISGIDFGSLVLTLVLAGIAGAIAGAGGAYTGSQYDSL